MARPDYSRYDDEPRRSSGGLSLSTGRLEGRSRSSAPRGSSRSARSGAGRSASTRHNPLRDEYPQSSDRRREPAPDRRHSGRARGEQAPSRSRTSGSRQASGRDKRARASHAASPFDPRTHVLGAGGLSFGNLDVRRLGTYAVAAFLVIVFAMALLHLGPFAAAPKSDGSHHVGVQGANAIGGNAAYLAQNVATQVSIARPVEPALAQLSPYTPTREDLANLAGQKAPYAFALNTGDSDQGAPVLSDRSLVNLNNALAYYDTNGYEASYLIMDLGTGRGIAGNLDTAIYGASSFKGPYCAYVVNKEFPNDINEARSSRVTQVENTIIWSDNSSYGKLRRTYGTEGMEEWLAEAGVDTALVDDTYFPTYTARQSALMWLKIYDYLENAGTSAAEWLSETFGSTEVSFLRNGALGTTSAGHTDYLPEEGSGTEEGVEEAEADVGEEAEVSADSSEASLEVEAAPDEGDPIVDEEKVVASIGTNITVRNKAGWIDGQEDDAVCDSGIVTINGRDYLMVVMTSAPDSADGEQAFAHLARTLFEVRSDLV